MTDYILDHHRTGERARLALMSQLLDPMHRRYINGLGIAPGTKALEVGCGNGSTAAWLGEQVMPGGRMVALDLDLLVVDAGAPNVEFRQGDIPPVRWSARHLILSPLALCCITFRMRTAPSRTSVAERGLGEQSC